MDVMPKWAEVVLVPLISLLLAAIISAFVILAIGEDPIAAAKLMVKGALGSVTYGWGYTLYYATSFIFTGLAVSIAFHARLFNIGGEGQAMLGGLGVALACLYVPWPHWSIALVAAALMAAAFCAFMGVDPGIFAGQARQPYRDHHDHVQLYRLGLVDLCFEWVFETCPFSGSGLGPVCQASGPAHVELDPDGFGLLGQSCR